MPNPTTVSGEVERPIENLVDMLIQAAREREAASRLPDCIAGADRRLTGAKEKLLQSLRVEPPSDVAPGNWSEAELAAMPPLREAALSPFGPSRCASQAKPTAAIAKGGAK
jgi:hypothetical protein